MADVVELDASRSNHPTNPASTGARVLAVLAGSPDEVFTPADLDGELADANYKTITTSLIGLVRSGKVVRRGRGQYQAVPT